MTPLVRAVIRGERIKRAYGPSHAYWHRWKAIRDRLVSQMTPDEFDEARDRVSLESHTRKVIPL